MEELIALGQVILVDLLFAGDNAIAVGLVAASLPAEQRKKVILIGVGLAVILRIIFAVATVQLLKIPGLLVVGGLLLLWVCWKLFIELRRQNPSAEPNSDHGKSEGLSFSQALVQILAADISMSLDNVLAVAGIARDHIYILVFGLALSVVLMLVAATYIANLLTKHRWLGYVGVIIILYVAVVMLWEGSLDVIYIMNQTS